MRWKTHGRGTPRSRSFLVQLSSHGTGTGPGSAILTDGGDRMGRLGSIDIPPTTSSIWSVMVPSGIANRLQNSIQIQQMSVGRCRDLQKDTEGGIFDATVHWSPKTGPKQTQTGSKTAHNSSKRVSKKYPLEGRAFGKTFT